VTFAGYKFPHPLDYHILLKVQTKGKKSPLEVVDDALQDLIGEYQDIKMQFEVRSLLFPDFRTCKTRVDAFR
jgi:DNA-directed RNA polymerase II subunit RPB11